MKYLALLTFALSVVSAAPSPNKKYYSLEACLTDSNVPMIGQSSSVFSKTIEPFNLRVPFTPALLAVPNTVRDVQKAVYCASKFDIKVAARGGGHSYAAMGLGGKDGSFIIDMKKFKSISLDRNNVATVGAGVRLGDLASALYDLGERALPHGLCPG